MLYLSAFVLTTKPTFIKWLLGLIALSIVIFAIYVNHLHNTIKDEFSKPFAETNTKLHLHQHPSALINMLLLVEDQSFFEHSGVDFKEIIKVLRNYLFFDKPIRGASTLTQQLIKNTLLGREKTITRKINEALMALLLEYSFDKEFILSRYMNTVYLGQQGNTIIYGFANAAQFYFQKPIDALSLAEMAALVALVKGPSFYHPVKHPKRFIKRQQLVLSLYNKYKKIIE